MIRRRLLSGAIILCLSACLCLGAIQYRAVRAWEECAVKLPIIMYHSILKDPKYTGKYVITPDQLEQDLIYLTENGYTTVTVQDLINHVQGTASLPEKPIMLTFDDGYYNNYLYAYPLMKKYQCKMVLAVIGIQSEKYSKTQETNAYYSHITWEQMKEMTDSGLVEIQNHSYDMHSLNKGRNGSKRKQGESSAAYEASLTNDLSSLQKLFQENLDYVPSAYVYPFGAISADSKSIIKKLGFLASFSCEARINVITQDPECLYLLGRYLRSSGTTSDAYFKKILKEAAS